jgi:MFS-type transporter involved in bile tolerance (Atg22 family)
MRKLGRKFWLFIITMIIITLLSFFNKDSTQIVALFGVYCAGNVGSKFSNIKKDI